MDLHFGNIPNGLISKELKQGLSVDPKLYPFGNSFQPDSNWMKSTQSNFDEAQRAILVNTIKDQIGANLHPEQELSIQKLLNPNTLTVTTGQQIHPFLGPLFVWSKIMTAVDNAKKLQAEFHKSIVPVFWMATEDHDFEEIKTVPFLGKDYVWQTNQTGCVGDFDTEGLVQLIDQIKSDYPEDNRIWAFLSEYQETYGKGRSLTQASIELVNKWFGEYGVLPLDASNNPLKKSAADIFLKELDGTNQAACLEQSRMLKEDSINAPIGVRSTRLFYIDNNKRLRIDETETGFETSDGKLRWTHQELKEEIQHHTEKFSPNVLLRPVYQQHILPNILYVAGPSEYLYWLQLTRLFDNCEVDIPWLKLRVMSTVTNASHRKKADQLGLTLENAFEPFEKLKGVIENEDPKALALKRNIDSLSDHFESIWAALYNTQSPRLKELKKAHKQVKKSLHQELIEYLDGDNHKNLVETRLNQLEKLKSGPYSEKVPLERSTFYFEWLFKKGSNIDYQLFEGDFVEVRM